jgi:MerR family copper efflux transcriptional regulator
MQIGQLARQAGVPVDTVRYYERRGLLSEPMRRPSGYREYAPTDVATLRFIRRSKALGFTLEETRELLRLSSARDADRGEIRALAAQRLADVEARLRELQSVRDTLAGLVTACSGHGPVAGCPIVERVLSFEPEAA